MPERDPADLEMPDLSACAREQIQFLGNVQAFGCLIVASPDWVVQNASENTAGVLSVPARDLVGTKLIEHLSPQAMHTLRGKVQTILSEEEGVRAFDVDLFGDERRFDVAIHRSANGLLFDFERKVNTGYRDDLSMVQPLLSRVRRAPTIEKMCEVAARGIWALTGFSRVMVYRFEPDDSGRVIAECTAPGMDKYLGFHFPASDIPAQARALYKRNLLRIIPDANGQVSPLYPERDPHGQPVDLSMAVTRAVSPVHLEYLRNMGVEASMSVSILREGELWGMFACHHPEPHYVDYETRSAVELFTQLFAYELNLVEEREEREHAARAQELHERLVTLFEAGGDFGEGLDAVSREIDRVIDFDGIALFSDGHYMSSGLTPDEDEFRALEAQLSRVSEGKVYRTEHLEGSMPGSVSPGRGIGGLLALPLKRRPRQFVMLFRHEVTHNVVWAGNPAKTEVTAGRISPRKSFSAWMQTVEGRSRPWTQGELRAAEVLRVTLLELVLRQTTESDRLGQRRREQQEVLISELNHRLRNAFGLVESLLTQGRPEHPEAAAEVEAVADRVRALARASERAYSVQRQPVRLGELISGAAGAVGEDGRLSFEGGDALLEAEVASTLSLVLHELVTNAAKHGAFSRRGGRVSVGIDATEDGGVRFTWSELDGPPGKPPSRAGFGTTLLTRSIPHEFGGEASLDYAPGGLKATFTLPPRFVVEMLGDPASGAAPAAPSSEELPEVGGPVLVVEDNYLIAMNATEALRKLGLSEVAVAASASEALRLLDRSGYAFAILDINLGTENSDAVAERLKAQGTPYMLATGYDRGGAWREDTVPLLHKPYDSDGLASAIRQLDL